MTNQKRQGSEKRHRHDRWLIIIGVFKILEGTLFVLLGLGVVRLLHRDIGDLLVQLAMSLRIDPESRFVNMVLEQIQLLTPHKMRLISAGIFLKAGLDYLEGIGLALEKSWAEWITIGLTASFLPWEIFEIIHRFTWVKVAITFLNVLVLVYLVWVQQLRLRHRER